MKPLAIDLYCGLGGWAEGFLAEGYEVIGFDIERHDYGTGGYPGQLVLQDVLTLHGSQFKDAAVIAASPPCQEPSYRAMPWKRAKALNAIGPPHKFMELFNACFRIQREACAAAGRHIPLIVENVKGAQPWVGRARWHFGSYYLWGDVPALMPVPARSIAKVSGQNWTRFAKTGEVSAHWRMEGLKGPETEWRENGCRADNNRMASDAVKNEGGSWFGVAHNTGSGVNNNPVSPRLRKDPRDSGVKGFTPNGQPLGKNTLGRRHGSSTARKAASAQIAKIPFALARHIAQCFRAERAA